jgi:hypothetical protein
MNVNGPDQIEISGRIAVANWQYASLFPTNFFAPYNTSWNSAGNYLSVNPVSMFPTTSREYLTAWGYTEFRFTKLAMQYENTTATSIQASGAVCYTPDGAATGSQFNTAGEVLAYPYSMAFAGWSSRMMDVSRYVSTERGWYYVDWSDDDFADYRQGFQGNFGGVTIGTAGVNDAYVFGVLYIVFTLQLRGARTGLDVALIGKRRSKSSRSSGVGSGLLQNTKVSREGIALTCEAPLPKFDEKSCRRLEGPLLVVPGGISTVGRQVPLAGAEDDEDAYESIRLPRGQDIVGSPLTGRSQSVGPNRDRKEQKK